MKNENRPYRPAPPYPCRRRSFGAKLGLMTAALVASQAVAQAPDAWHANAESVLELLQADTRRAWAATGLSNQSRPALSSAAAAQPPDELELAALYGTSGRLTAVVYVNGVRKEYRPGAKLPYAGAGGSREYRLLRIADTCVVLQKTGRAARSVCFRTDMPEPGSPPSLAGSNALAAGHSPALGAPLPAAMRP